MPTIHRIEVRPRDDRRDPVGEAARAAVVDSTKHRPSRINAGNVYLIEADLAASEIEAIAEHLLADPITEEATIGITPPRADAIIEVHPLPGVMDPDAQPIELAIESLLERSVTVRIGRRYDIAGVEAHDAADIAARVFANPVVHAIHAEPYCPDAFPVAGAHDAAVHDVPLTTLDDAALARLSRDAHLFLSLEEMQAVQSHYRGLGREPREIELETLAQTWSEHCVHKTLKATINYRESPGAHPSLEFAGRPGHEIHDDGSVTIHNLLKSTVAAATHELIADGIDWCLSVFVDNAGIIAFDEKLAVCFKCETHNHPSAIEPYGGAATGIGGCIRDIMGTGLAARPIAATDIFCVAPPNVETVPNGCLHPRRVLTQVVAGVRDYGNRMGIPTLNGAVWFDDHYIGNPLVYCGCIGVMPRDLTHGDPRSGDHIIALGGRTGRDGIHGATFSSAELTDTHADEFAHAVQIGNPVMEKKTLDAIMEARDHHDGCLFSAITDCGAGGFSSAVGEMGEHLGATVHLDRAPLKYAGLSPTEIWISEAQERMVLAVPRDNIAALQTICDRHDVELADLGTFGTDNRELILVYNETEVGRLDMEFMHNGVPNTTKTAEFTTEHTEEGSRAGLKTKSAACSVSSTSTSSPSDPSPSLPSSVPSVSSVVKSLLAHPNIASKRWIIRQYDHEVQGATIVKPLTGPTGRGPSDAAVVQPVPTSNKGLGIACGLATGFAEDPYTMTLNAIDECVRNLVCTGVDPQRIAILDNFCWPSCNDPANLGTLVRAAEACYDGAKAYQTPFISGKDSLNNQFTIEDGETIQIPPTLLISGMGIVPDINQCITTDAKRAGHRLIMLGENDDSLRGSHYAMLYGSDDTALPITDLQRGPHLARTVHTLIQQNLIHSAHDISDGGLLCAIAEMCIGATTDIGFTVDDDIAQTLTPGHLFSEAPSRYLLEVAPDDLDAFRSTIGDAPFTILGTIDDSAHLRSGAHDLDIATAELSAAWRGALDW